MKENKYFFLGFVMKKEFLFWGLMALIVAFYLSIGNGMHEERNEIFSNNKKIKELNTTN